MKKRLLIFFALLMVGICDVWGGGSAYSRACIYLSLIHI